MNNAHTDNENAMYEKATSIITDYIESGRFKPSAPEEKILEEYKWFQETFSPEKLKKYSDDELLQKMFLNVDADKSNLCYYLEYKSEIKSYFGSISGGSAFKYGLFQRKADGKWMTGPSKKQIELSNAEALTRGKKIRDFIVNACEYIAGEEFTSVHDYESLDDKLNAEFKDLASFVWIQKYFQMIFPDKFAPWYSKDLQNHMLFSFGIIPSEKNYGRNGQLALIRKKTRFNNVIFGKACYDLYGDVIHFYRLGSSDGKQNFAEYWKAKGIIAIGWGEVGDLENYVNEKGKFNREKLAEKLNKLRYRDNANIASRKAGELRTFYSASENSVFVVMDGERLLGFVETTEYYFDKKEPMPHCRKGTWLLEFEGSETLPEKEGVQTSCVELRKPKNLSYLYDRYLEVKDKKVAPPFIDKPKRLAGGRNVLLYGVPGSGKSWTLEHEYCPEESVVERVVFHPRLYVL